MMGNKKNNLSKIYGVAILVIVLDQLSKLLVHNFMDMGTFGEVKVIGDWFRLHYLLNPGMAFGMEFGNEYGKLILTTFRIIASGGIVYGLYIMNEKGAHWGFLVCGAMILGGAIGNSIDSVFYGVFIEGNMIPNSPTPWFHGQVIDMLYFPMVRGNFPDWLPFYGGDKFLFFSPVFNIADSAIFLGVLFIFIFQNKFAEYDKKELKKEVIEKE